MECLPICGSLGPQDAAVQRSCRSDGRKDSGVCEREALSRTARGVHCDSSGLSVRKYCARAGCHSHVTPRRRPFARERVASTGCSFGPFVLVGLLVDGVIAGTLAATPTFPAAPWSFCGCRVDGADTIATSVRALRAFAETWRSEHAPNDCPTPERLMNDRAIDSASRITDAWNHPYVIRCETDETVVTSWGPNGRDDGGAGDDIQVPPPAPRAPADREDVARRELSPAMRYGVSIVVWLTGRWG